ncbi:hypothetical protein EZ428_18185 [Pedobacter frigiditerrae]|uniref:Cyclic nucleotide-binding domain-containing protein n=1 Tax=Pedobacter frigiditerrae TaxID=2530452 RepID=A0A4R0MP52_9SPHI|nr:metallophosphoesterase [Pedobacter frigiditerrae]TCC88570.1 hypothetical protein EZ428_18185 [Pedobacter frigiditerrae]
MKHLTIIKTKVRFLRFPVAKLGKLLACTILSASLLLPSCSEVNEGTLIGDAETEKYEVPNERSALSDDPATGDEFTLVLIGDTQNYVDFENNTGDSDCQTYQPLLDQMQWIADNKTIENIKYVITLGDMTDNYNPNPATTEGTNQWTRIRTAYNILRDANVPFGAVPGNHDQLFESASIHSYPVHPGYTSNFGRSQFISPAWPNANFHKWEYPAGTNENHIDVVNTPAGELAILYFRWEHERSASVAARDAAYAEITKPEYANRKIIIATHFAITPTYQDAKNDAEWGLLGHDNYYQSGELYDKFKDLPNFFLLVGGHVGGEVQRHETHNGVVVQSYNSDYSGCSRPEGMLRTLRFSKVKDKITLKTFVASTGEVTNQFDRPWTRWFTTSRTNDYFNYSKSQPTFYVGATWKITNPTLDVNYGLSTDIAVPGDYDGDGTTDPAIFRDGVWKRKNVEPDVTLGSLAEDIPVPGDYDGNGTSDCAIYRPSEKKFYVRQTYSSANTTYTNSGFGNIPVAADYDGDGKVNFATFNTGTAQWVIPGISSSVYGQSGDIPVPGDYNGTGRNTRAIFRKKTGTMTHNEWYVYGNATPILIGTTSNLIPVPGDYNGDGKTDIAVYNPTDGKVTINGQATLLTGILNAKPLNLPYHIRKFFF